MGSQIISQAPRIAKALPLIAGGITGASTMKPEDIQTILSTLSGGNPGISSVLDTLKDEDEGKIINFEEKKKLKKDSDPDPEDDGKDLMTLLQDIQSFKKELEKEELESQANRQKENTSKKILQEILPENIKSSGRLDIMNKYGNEPFVNTDFFVNKGGRKLFATDEQLAKIQKDFNSLVGKVTTLKKTGGMVDKSISYPPRS